MKVISLGVFLLFLQPAYSQYNWGELDKKLEDNQRLLGNNVVCLLWKGDSLIYKKEMGGFNSKTQAPIASCSKWLTAALVMQFVDEGKISLDDKVSKYLPIFENYFKGYITIRQCLCHMTGIADDKNFLKRILERRKFSSLEEEVNDFAAKHEIRSKPGTDFWYGNIGLNIAGRILEVVSKKKFEILIKQKLFTPLGMSKTTFNDPNGAVNPSGGAQSTADDYMKFLVMLMNKGKYMGQQILSENAVDIIKMVQNTTDQIRYAPKAAEGYTYALGSWVVEDKPALVIKNTKEQSDPTTNNVRRIATSLASPGLFGTWPMIDFCRGYAYIVFVKNLLGDERAEVHKEIKKIIDQQLPVQCK